MTNSHQYTAEEIKAQTTVLWWTLRKCSICDAPIGYDISPDKAQVLWQGTCDCTSYYIDPEPRSWQHIADTINMQIPETQQRMLAELRGEESGKNYEFV